MNDKPKYIKFKGQDFTDISLTKMSFSYNGKDYIEYENEKSVFSVEEKNGILKAFLNKAAPNGKLNKEDYIIGYSEDTNYTRNERKLYSPDFGSRGDKEYYGGIVGVISDSIEFISDSDHSEEAETTQKYNVTLQIQTRVDAKGSKPFFLATMLRRDGIIWDDNTVPADDEELFDFLLLFRFMKHLETAILKGYYKSYRRFEKNDDHVKGSIDIARHIRTNLGQNNGRIAYSYRENTIDNYLNQLIVAAYDHLKRKYPELVINNIDSNLDLYGVIAFLKYETGYGIQNHTALLKNNARKISHPFFSEYEDLRITCIKILRDESVSFFDGINDEETQSILFYLPDLWELYLKDVMISKVQDVLYSAQVVINSFGKYDDKGIVKYEQETRPDYQFMIKTEESSKTIMILDAKFKPEKWNEAIVSGKIGAVMEDYNKCIRDMVSANTHATGVIFPIEEKDRKSRVNKSYLEHPISELNQKDMFYTIPVCIPSIKGNETYSEWENRLEFSIGESKKILQCIVERERDWDCSGNETRKDIVYT